MGTIWFPLGGVRKDLSPKERVVGIEVGEENKAYAIEQLKKQPGTLKDKVGGVPVQIEVNEEG